jgi:hypothetical protein
MRRPSFRSVLLFERSSGAGGLARPLPIARAWPMGCGGVVHDAEREDVGCVECSDTRADRRRVREVAGFDVTGGGRRDVYVDFNRYGIRPGDPKSLATNEEWLESDRGALVLVEGSRDERAPRAEPCVRSTMKVAGAKVSNACFAECQGRRGNISPGHSRLQ